MGLTENYGEPAAGTGAASTVILKNYLCNVIHRVHRALSVRKCLLYVEEIVIRRERSSLTDFS